MDGAAVEVIRPSFIPPEIPPPLINLTTGAGIKRAIPIFAWAIANGASYADCLDVLVCAYVRHVWKGEESTFDRNYARIESLLTNAAFAAEAVATRISPSPEP